MTQEDLDKIAHIEADMNDYIYRKRAEWIVNGNIDAEWDDYRKNLKNTDFQITSLLNKILRPIPSKQKLEVDYGRIRNTQ